MAIPERLVEDSGAPIDLREDGIEVEEFDLKEPKRLRWGRIGGCRCREYALTSCSKCPKKYGKWKKGQDTRSMMVEVESVVAEGRRID